MTGIVGWLRQMCLIVVLGLGAGLATPARANDAQLLAAAIGAAQQGDWTLAVGTARRGESPLLATYIDWVALRDGQGRWQDYTGFLARNADWPGLDLMRKKAEAAMPAGLGAAEVIAFFSAHAPQTGTGALAYATALARSGRAAEAGDILARAWREFTLTDAEFGRFLADFGQVVAPHHSARLENLLWQGATRNAEAMLPYVDAPRAALARARLGLRANVNGVDGLVSAVPASLQNDPGLAYERMQWRSRKGRWQSAEELVIAQSTSAAALGRPDEWAARRRGLAREALREGRVQAAYRLASQHYLSGGSDYSDLEWLAGYIAMTRLGDPARAIQHFERMRAAVATPISLGRAGYWLGRAHEAAGDSAAARQAHALGAANQTSFYGQLAAERAGLAVDGSFAGSANVPDWRQAGFMRAAPVQMALLLHKAGEPLLALRFFLHVQEGLSDADSASMAQLGLDLGQPIIGIYIAKRLAEKNLILPQAYYPVADVVRAKGAVAPEFAMAIARQESELNPAAVSPAGARGLMQLMPGTARKVAGDLGVQYSQAMLTEDPAYNALLGTTYLAEMLQRFGGSVLLASAAYNAGPNRVDAWIAQYGDPRAPGADPVAWIENIPYNETRNYVMRVTESLHVYRSRIKGQAGPIGLAQALGIR